MRCTEGLGGTWGTLAASKRLFLRDDVPVELKRRPFWSIPGLEFRDESDELTARLSLLGFWVGDFNVFGVARGNLLLESEFGVSSLIRFLKQ